MKKYRSNLIQTLIIFVIVVSFYGTALAVINEIDTVPVASPTANEYSEIIPDFGNVTELNIEVPPIDVKLESKEKKFLPPIFIIPIKSFGKDKPIFIVKPWIVFVNREGEITLPDELKETDIKIPSAIHRVKVNESKTVTAWFKVEFFPKKIFDIAKSNIPKSLATFCEKNGISEANIPYCEYRPLPIDDAVFIVNEVLEKTTMMGEYKFTNGIKRGYNDAIVFFDSIDKFKKFCSPEKPDDVKCSLAYRYRGTSSSGGTSKSEITIKRIQDIFNNSESHGDDIGFTDKNGTAYVFQEHKNKIISDMKADYRQTINADNPAVIPFLMQTTNFDHFLTMENINWTQEPIPSDIEQRTVKYLEPILKTMHNARNEQKITDEEQQLLESILKTISDTKGLSYKSAATGVVDGVALSAALSALWSKTETKAKQNEVLNKISKQSGVGLQYSEEKSGFVMKNIKAYRLAQKESINNILQEITLSFNKKQFGYDGIYDISLTFTIDTLENIQSLKQPLEPHWVERLNNIEKATKILWDIIKPEDENRQKLSYPSKP
ncbi:MAG: hypothetical protein LBP59_01795 [Planctomycetaceae bacterium]|jgi:hypothetical protein|nr:hypothetical protein [Planctomycetaceae bacterium]